MLKHDAKKDLDEAIDTIEDLEAEVGRLEAWIDKIQSRVYPGPRGYHKRGAASRVLNDTFDAQNGHWPEECDNVLNNDTDE